MTIPQTPPHSARRISLELSQSWPGEMYLRFKAPHVPAVMVAVTQEDLVRIHDLIGCPHEAHDQSAEAGFGLPYAPEGSVEGQQ